MHAKWISLTVIAALAAGGLIAGDSKHKEIRATQIFMRKKLAYSQNVVEGICLENYSLVLSNSERLWGMTQSNTWGMMKNTTYLEKTDHYKADVTALVDAARGSNTPAMLQAYTKVTGDCVDCHQTFRHDQFARSAQNVEKK